MIPTGAASLNDIVTDLDLSTSAANLNDARIRARAKKHSGQISVNDLRGTVAACMPTIVRLSQSDWDQPLRWRNNIDLYDPNGNRSGYDLSMVSDGDASQGTSLMVRHFFQNGGDVTASVVHLGYMPVDAYGINVEGIIKPTLATINTYMKWELVSWDGNWFNGVPFYNSTVDNIRTETDLSPYGSGIEVRARYPYIASIFYVVVKSAAPDLASSTGTVEGFKLWR